VIGVPMVLVGLATFYAAGVMEQVVANRVRWGQISPCAECVGHVALLDPETIGRRVWLQAPGRPVEGPFLVVDCAAPQDRDYLLSRGWVVDLDWETGQRWGMNAPLAGVRVLFEVDEGTGGTEGTARGGDAVVS